MRTIRLSSTLVALALSSVMGSSVLVSGEGPGWIGDICTSRGSAPANETQFLTENTTAMAKMMKDMAVKPTGNIDADFVAMMIPHHQGAIDMAIAVLQYGSNPRVKRIAQEIIITQQQEIEVMRLAVGQPLSVPSATRPSPRLSYESH
jgi:Domain of unknown function (DUF305)